MINKEKKVQGEKTFKKEIKLVQADQKTQRGNKLSFFPSQSWNFPDKKTQRGNIREKTQIIIFSLSIMEFSY